MESKEFMEFLEEFNAELLASLQPGQGIPIRVEPERNFLGKIWERIRSMLWA